MGSTPPTGTRGRTWRRTAGAASLRFGDGAGPNIPSERPSPTDRHESPLPRTGALKTQETLRPGENGTKRLLEEFGESLVCVRYRCDPKNRKRYKTVELVVAEADWDPPPGPNDLVQVRVAWGEEGLRKTVKEAGGRWRAETKTWELPNRVALELGLKNRIV